MCDEEGGRERKEKVGGGLRWSERQWWSEWVVMGRANLKKIILYLPPIIPKIKKDKLMVLKVKKNCSLPGR